MTQHGKTYLRWGLLALLLLPFGLQAQQPPVPATRPPQATPAAPGADGDENEKPIVNYHGDLMTQRPGDSILYLNDNVAFHHNGTFIQCDSAKRYDRYRMECFGNVIINKDSTYIYGDRASYDGHTNTAKVYAPLLKLINGDATMWVFNHMEFNTQTNIGEYNEGAVIVQRDNLMESDRGTFNGDSSTITFIGHVAMRNDNYQIRTDSVDYNLNNEIVTFLTKTYIWDKERDFLTADRGNYVRATETYHFTRDAYAMTQDQEFWADTMDYESAIRKVTMQHDIQILDTAQRAIGLGDFGFYSDSLGNGMLTDNPAVILYDTLTTPPTAAAPKADTLTIALSNSAADTTIIQPFVPKQTPTASASHPPRPDSAFTRADTILFNSYPPGTSKPKSTPSGTDTIPASDSLAPNSAPTLIDSLPADSIATDCMAADSTTTDTMAMRRPISVEEPPAPTAPDSTLFATDTIPIADSAAQLPPLSPDSANQETLDRVIRARHNVKLWRTDIQGICDSLTAYTVDSMVSLFGRPLIWNGYNQLTADQIDIYTDDEELDYAEFIGTPFITQQVANADTLFNQAQGRFLQTWFTDNSISRAIMTGNVQNYYYMGDDSLPPDKFAILSCASLTIDFEDQEPVRFNWGGQGDWHIDPLDKIPAGQSQRLSGFSWEPERKPRNRYDITHRRVRPSQRLTAEGYARPVFSIEEHFVRTRDELLKEGIWRDRDEPLWVTIDTFNQNKLLY